MIKEVGLRLYFVLIVSVVAMAFGTGYFAFFIQEKPVATGEDIAAIEEVKLGFQASVDPRAILNLNALYPTQDHFQLIDPLYTMTAPGTASSLSPNQFTSNQNCFENLQNLTNIDNFEKVWFWESFRCGKTKRLGGAFFRDPPYMHPSGRSFAYLAYLSGKAPFTSINWIRRNLAYFHIRELARLREQVGPLGGAYDFLATLNEEELSALSKGHGTILTRQHLWARLRYPSLFSILEYRVYTRRDLEEYLEGTPFILKNLNAKRPCFYKDGSLCWEYSAKHFFQMTNKGYLVLFGGLILIVALVIRLFWVKLRNDRLEDERRRLALRVLTHEFRTPIASLLLQTESLNRKLHELDDDTQDSILRMSSEVYRLQRLTELSRHYLKVDNKQRLIEFRNECHTSLRYFVEEMLEDYVHDRSNEFSIESCSEDGPIQVDSYWIRICLTNLVENAFNHGKAPVKVSLDCCGRQAKWWSISVTDAGECEFNLLDEMTTEFVKGNLSQGSGLGLKIVRQIIEEMGGKLEFSKNPTTFTILLPKKVKRPLGEVSGAHSFN